MCDDVTELGGGVMNEGMEEDLNVEDVMAVLPESAELVDNLFARATQAALERRESEPTDGFFPYDTTPTIVSESLLEEFKKTLELAHKTPTVASQLLTKHARHFFDWGDARGVCLCSTWSDLFATVNVCDVTFVPCITERATLPTVGISPSKRSSIASLR